MNLHVKATIVCALAVALAAVAAPAADAARGKSPAVKRPVARRVSTKPRGGTFVGSAAGADWQSTAVRARVRVRADRKRLYLKLGDLPELGYVITTDRVDAKGNRYVEYELPKSGSKLWSKNIRAANDERGGFANRENGLATKIASRGSLFIDPSGQILISQTATSEVSFALLTAEERKALDLPELALESTAISFQGKRTSKRDPALGDPPRLFAPRRAVAREGSVPNPRFLLILDGTPPGLIQW